MLSSTAPGRACQSRCASRRRTGPGLCPLLLPQHRRLSPRRVRRPPRAPPPRPIPPRKGPSSGRTREPSLPWSGQHRRGSAERRVRVRHATVRRWEASGPQAAGRAREVAQAEVDAALGRHDHRPAPGRRLEHAPGARHERVGETVVVDHVGGEHSPRLLEERQALLRPAEGAAADRAASPPRQWRRPVELQHAGGFVRLEPARARSRLRATAARRVSGRPFRPASGRRAQVKGR